MSDIYLYKNKMWKVKHKFEYSGHPEAFHLDAGKYLFICRGANGGAGRLGEINHGGTSYGVINLTSELNAYAVVGGNGGPSVSEYDAYGVGGYNGGGRGGKPYPGTNYNCGAGGGGASDIRLSLAPPVPIPGRIHQVPDYFDEIEYLESTGYQTMDIQSIHKADTRIECECEIIENSDRTWETIFGARNWGMGAQLVFFGRFGDVNIPCFGCNSWEVQGSNLVYDQPIKIVIEGNTASWYDDQDQLIDSIVCEYGDQVNGENNMYLFNMNSGGSPDGSNSKVKIKSFKMTTDGQLVRYLVPFKNNGYSIDTTNVPFESGTISISSGQNNDDPRYYNQIRSVGYVEWDPAWTYFNIAAIIDGANTMHLVDYYDENHNFLGHNNWHTCNSSDRYQVLSGTRYIRILLGDWNGPMIDETHLDSLAIYGYATTAASGMYDLVSERYFTKGDWDSDFVTGPIVSERTQYREYETIDVSALSRIMVAGGGGGGQQLDGNDYSNICGFGGGYNGGYIDTNPDCSHYGDYASQSSGGGFGVGQPGPHREGSSSQYGSGEGISGGGGGWFGGYASQEGDAYVHAWSSCNGGGGSGYVLTATSWKPEDYMYGLTPRDDLNFTDILMTAGTADVAEVIVCEEVAAYSSGDRLICDCIGEQTAFPLIRGTFTVECFGGSGGHRTKLSKVPCGGYAKGTFDNPIRQTAYAVVGGAAIYAGSNQGATYIQTTHPTLSFNGGGQPGSFSDLPSSAEAGGGGTDLRVGSNSLYARIIVAGGAGGCGNFDHTGGTGGGASGGEYSGGGSGDNYGPGTQESAGSGSISMVSGSFGYGGNGRNKDGGYGGAGGGGWFGGSGTSPDGGSDDDKGGSGGSGYVLTESSWKPSGYLLDENYYMRDTTLTAGGNSKKHYTGMIITCDHAENLFMLCHDSNGYKYYDELNQRWTFLKSETPTESDFTTYGSGTFISDVGLNSSYTVCVWDPMATANTMIFDVYPPSQSVKFRYRTPYLMSRYNIDCDVDEDAMTFDVETERRGMAEDAYIYFTFNYTFNSIPKQLARVYCIQGFTQGSTATSSSIPREKTKTIARLNLLPVGSGNRLPSRYKNYIGGYINGDEPITEITSAVCCEHNRCIYSATLCNNKVVRFAKLNLVTNTSYVIKDIPKSELGNTSYGDIKVDDEYIYLSPGTNNTSRTIWKTPNSSTPTVYSYSLSNSDDYNINARGRMEWFDDHTLILLYRRGFVLFNTLTNAFVYKQNSSQNEGRRDMILGEKYGISIYDQTTRSAWIWDIEADEWHGLSEYYGQEWSSSELNCGCYHDGTFYVVQRGMLHFLDEETMTITKRIPTPFTTLDPKQIAYADGILYIIIQNKPTLFMYDIARNIFSTVGLPFTIDDWNENGWIRMCAFKGYGFIPNIRMFTINYTARAKYSLGYKYDQFMIITNAENAADPDNHYEYDERYVTFTSDNMTIHAGEIICPLTEDLETGIKSCSMSKDQYHILVETHLELIENDESEANNNEQDD